MVAFHLITPAGSRGEGFGIRNLSSPDSRMTVGNTWTPDEEKNEVFHGFVEVRGAGGAPAFSPTSALIPPFQIHGTSMRGVSQAGIVGFTVDSGSNLQFPFLLDRNGFRRLELSGVNPPKGPSPKYAAFGINDVGVVVGTHPKKVKTAVVPSGFALAAGLLAPDRLSGCGDSPSAGHRDSRQSHQ